MFGKLSRYRKVPDVAVPDAEGRILVAKDIRPLPEVTGIFGHTVEAGDRLDQLAYSYHGEPLQYWHICDANPQFLSPLALLDKEPVMTARFPVTAPTGDPPWAALLTALSGTVGVEDVTVIEDVTVVPQQQVVDGKPVTVAVDRYTRAVRVRYNRLSVEAPAVAAVIAAAGFAVGPPSHGGQLGQRIVIPAAVSG